jgi:hypothetical protein
VSKPPLVVSIASNSQQSRKLLQHGNQLVTSESESPSQFEKFLRLGENDTSLGFAHHADTTTTSELEDPFVSEDPQSPQHCVRVDPQYRRHVFGRREALTRSHVSIRNIFSNLGGHLVVQGGSIAE